MPQHDFLFSGYYGLGNAGDEAVLAASVQLLREMRPDARIGVLSADTAGTTALHGVPAFRRMSLETLLPALRSSRVLLSGGGSLLQDKTSLKSLLYYLVVIRLAKLAGCRTMIFAQGIGPLVRPAARRLTGRVLRRVDRITVRDAGSADLLRDIGVSGKGAPEIEVTADPVFALREDLTGRVSAELEAVPGPRLGIALRPWAGMERTLDALVEALKAVNPRPGLSIWALHPHDDGAMAGEFAARVGGRAAPHGLTPAEWMALAGRMDAVVAVRLHALIFAAARGVPVLGISYDPKVDAVLERLGAPAIGTAGSLDADRAAAAVSRALQGTGTTRAERLERAAELAALARRSAAMATELLDGGSHTHR